MANKTIMFSLTLLLFTLSISGYVKATPTAALLVEDGTNLNVINEEPIYAILSSDLGMNVLVYDGNNYTDIDYDNTDILVITGRPFYEFCDLNAYAYLHNISASDHPTIAISTDWSFTDEWGWTSEVVVRTKRSKIYVINNTHPITDGISLGDIQVFPTGDYYLYKVTPSETTFHALAYDQDPAIPSTRLTLMYLDDGETLQNGMTANAKQVFFGVSSPGVWTTSARKIFKQAVTWAADDNDVDNDGIINDQDNCPNVSNPAQSDMDGDSVGDLCDPDADADGFDNDNDNCWLASNPLQENIDGDAYGNVCDICLNDPDNDVDGDGYCANDGFSAPKIGDNDNCVSSSNPDQADTDSDGIGDVCDNCAAVGNPNQEDQDSDFVGDVCDNCIADANTGQEDIDSDGIGDVCDPEDNRIDIAVIGVEYQPTNPLACSSLTFTVTVKNVDADSNVSGYVISVYSGSTLAAEKTISTALTTGNNETTSINAGYPYTCGDTQKTFTIKAEASFADINEADNEMNKVVTFISAVAEDVDGDDTYEIAANQNADESDGFEYYKDPNTNTNALGADVDGDGKTDFMIDIGKDSDYDKYWDPDEAILSDVFDLGSWEIFDSTGDGIPNKRHNTTGIFDLVGISSDVDNNGNNETVFDVNGNNQIDSEDRVWDGTVKKLPDIKVSSISFSPTSPTSGSTFTVKAVIQNIGELDANSFVVEIKKGTASLSNSTITIIAGESVTVSKSLSISSTGTYTFYTYTDTSGLIVESLENNNDASKSVAVTTTSTTTSSSGGSSGSSGGGYRSAKIVDMPVEVIVEAGKKETFTAEIQNDGGITLYDVRLEFDGPREEWLSVKPATFDKMLSGESETFTITVSLPSDAVIGDYEFTARLKATNVNMQSKKFYLEVIETKEEEVPENENEAEGKIVIESITVPEVSQGNSIEATISMRNEGNATSGVNVSIVLPEGWNSDSLKALITLLPNENKSFVFTLTPPEGFTGQDLIGFEIENGLGSHSLNKTITVIATGIDLSGFASLASVPLMIAAIVVAGIVLLYIAKPRINLKKKSSKPWEKSIRKLKKR